MTEVENPSPEGESTLAPPAEFNNNSTPSERLADGRDTATGRFGPGNKFAKLRKMKDPVREVPPELYEMEDETVAIALQWEHDTLLNPNAPMELKAEIAHRRIERRLGKARTNSSQELVNPPPPAQGTTVNFNLAGPTGGTMSRDAARQLIRNPSRGSPRELIEAERVLQAAADAFTLPAPSPTPAPDEGVGTTACSNRGRDLDGKA